MNPDRSAFVLDNLPDLVVDNEDEQSSLIFGDGFGPITDLETGPDGYLYVLSHDDGIIYRIVPSSSALSSSPTTGADEPTSAMSPIEEQGQDDQAEEDSTNDDNENGDENN
jgi:hypothetical protein